MPKFTIRQLLFSFVIFAFVFAVLGWAVRGNVSAFGLGVAIFGLVIPFFVFASIYWLSWLVGISPNSHASNSFPKTASVNKESSANVGAGFEQVSPKRD